jgi:tetratricopeptide (TPR) repeat protein
MKKSTLVLSALLSMGVASSGLTHASYAQPAPLDFSQALIQIQADFKSKNYEVAEKNARQLLALANAPDETSQAHLILGEVFYLRKMFEPARAEWNKLLTPMGDADSDANLVVTHLNLARTYTAENNYEKAIPHLKAGIAALQEDDAPDEKNKDKEKAGEIKEVDQKKTVLFSLALANALFHTGQFDLAQEQWAKLIDFSQDLPTLHLIVLTRSSQIDIVQRHYKKALAGYEQVLASKEEAPLIKAFAKNQIKGLNTFFLPNHFEAGEVNESVKIEIEPEDKLTDPLKINAFIQNLNDTLLDSAIIESLRE